MTPLQILAIAAGTAFGAALVALFAVRALAITLQRDMIDLWKAQVQALVKHVHAQERLIAAYEYRDAVHEAQKAAAEAPPSVDGVAQLFAIQDAMNAHDVRTGEIEAQEERDDKLYA